MDTRLISERFPRSNKYNPEWLKASASSGANTLWTTEWLSEALDLKPGMRVLDLGCGRAMSSIFLHREFGVNVWATDLWFSATENLQRIRAAGVEDGVFPIQCDARSLPYGEQFFDAIVCLDSLNYYGTGDLFLNYLAAFVKPGGVIAMAGAGFTREFYQVPIAFEKWWEPSMYSLHSAAWWQRHWEKSAIVDVELADSMPGAWKYLHEWQQFIAPHNLAEIQAIEADQGEYWTYIRCVARRRLNARLEAVNPSIPAAFEDAHLLRQ